MGSRSQRLVVACWGACVAAGLVVAACFLLRGTFPFLPRFAPLTTALLVLLAVEACLERRSTRHDSGRYLVLPILAFLVGYLNTVDYLDGAVSVVGLAYYTNVPPQDIVILLLLSSVTLYSRTDRGVARLFAGDEEGARTARYLLLAVLLLPPALAWARQEGAALGLYDEPFGDALMCVANLVVFALLLSHCARALRTSDMRRQEALDAVQALNLALEARVGERTASLEKANRDLQEMDKLKSHFVATMSHELRTPLNAILGFTDVALFEQAGAIAEEQRHFLQVTHHAGMRLRRLIDDMLLVSRIEAGRCDVQCDWFDLHSSLQRIVARMQSLAKEKGLVLALSLPAGEPPVLRSDERRLDDVISRLVDNAIRFTPAGTVGVTCSRQDGGIVIEIRDTGIGIRPEDFPLLFQPFRQLSSSYQRTHDGAGLSLFMCQRLCTLLGGTIGVTSEVGRGTCFTLRLACPELTGPLSPEALDAPESARAPQGAPVPPGG